MSAHGQISGHKSDNTISSLSKRYGWNIVKHCDKQQTTLNITITVLTHNPIHIKQHSTETKDVRNSG
jgi:hypothetical protein